MRIEENKSLKSYNTFGIDCKARYFLAVSTVEELKEALSLDIAEDGFILGGGSNLLITTNLEKAVIHVNLKGISAISEDDDHIILEVMAGENWHDFVLYCLEQGYGGIENLSLIPGNVGTAPIQNIGAYGVELVDVMVSCNAMEISTLKLRTFGKEDCKFGYRSSIFKSEEKGKFIITSVQFRLTKRNHLINTSYGAILEELKKRGITDPGPREVSDAVIAIRQSKLPDPAVLGNSGSFFKNPVVNGKFFREFINLYPDAPSYKVDDNTYKIPAGWLIEKAGFKGKRFGDAAVHNRQALVLVNYGDASGQEIWELALRIQKKISEMFSIRLEPEVNVI